MAQRLTLTIDLLASRAWVVGGKGRRAEALPPVTLCPAQPQAAHSVSIATPFWN